MIPALTFVLINDLDQYFDDLSGHFAHERSLLLVLDYFESTYLGQFHWRGNQRRPSFFPPDVWNVYNRTVNGQACTNNAVEAWHWGTSLNIGSQHLTL